MSTSDTMFAFCLKLQLVTGLCFLFFFSIYIYLILKVIFYFQTIQQILSENYCESESEQTDTYCQSSDNEGQTSVNAIEQVGNVQDSINLSSVETSTTCDLNTTEEMDTSEQLSRSVPVKRVSLHLLY